MAAWISIIPTRYLRDEARRFLAAACPPAAARTALDTGASDRALWDRIAGQGWLGTAIPEAYGGLGLSHVELGALAEEIGAALAPVPFASTLYFFAEAVMTAGNEAQKGTLLPATAEGRLVRSVAGRDGLSGKDRTDRCRDDRRLCRRPSARPDAAAIQTTSAA